MIAAVLQSTGYRTGLYTSPHLVQFNERIRINGEMISDSNLARYTTLFRPRIDALKATFFEATTAIAFKYFADQKVDIAVIETGLGGRLDATNVLVPEVSVITSIAKDHTQYLGKTLQKIAFEKGGIIKPGKACVVGVRSQLSLRELRKIAAQRRSQFITTDNVRSSKVNAVENGFQGVDFVTENHSYKNLHIPLIGENQIRNAEVAITALEYLQTKGVAITAHAVRQGFTHLQRLTGIRGRFETLRRHPLVILDVGHNPEAISAIAASLRALSYRRLILVFGVMKDKDYKSMVRILSSLNPIVYAVQPAMERALPAATITDVFRRMNCIAYAPGVVSDGIREALRTQKENDLLLICGSHYVAGEALQAIQAMHLRKSS